MKRVNIEYDQAVLARCFEKITAHNSNFEKTMAAGITNGTYHLDRYFIIDTTGVHEVYYTLYQYKKPMSAYVNPYTFIKNLSIDLETAVNAVIKRSVGNIGGNKVYLPILLLTESNNSPLAMNFRSRTKEGIPTIPIGKYRGKTLSEVWDLDRNWVFWFKDNYKTKAYRDFRDRLVDPKLSDLDIALRTQAENLIDIFFTELTEKNRIESTSDYIAPLKTRITCTCTIQSVSIATDEDGNVKNKKYIADVHGNRICFYSKRELNPSDVVNLTGTVTRHFESLGRKTSYLNRVNC